MFLHHFINIKSLLPRAILPFFGKAEKRVVNFEKSLRKRLEKRDFVWYNKTKGATDGKQTYRFVAE